MQVSKTTFRTISKPQRITPWGKLFDPLWADTLLELPLPPSLVEPEAPAQPCWGFRFRTGSSCLHAAVGLCTVRVQYRPSHAFSPNTHSHLGERCYHPNGGIITQEQGAPGTSCRTQSLWQEAPGFNRRSVYSQGWPEFQGIICDRETEQ